MSYETIYVLCAVVALAAVLVRGVPGLDRDNPDDQMLVGFLLLMIAVFWPMMLFFLLLEQLARFAMRPRRDKKEIP